MMKNKKVEANLSMVFSKTFSGLNMNALKYLLPVWVSPLSGVTLRCVFAAIAFWIIGMFVKPETSTRKEKIFLFLLGALGIYGFMFLYLMEMCIRDRYMSNAKQAEQTLDAYFVSNLNLAYTFQLPHVKSVTVGFTIYNLFNEKYENNGYAGSGYTLKDGKPERYNYAGYAAQAGTCLLYTSRCV